MNNLGVQCTVEKKSCILLQTRDPMKAIAVFCYCLAAVLNLFLYMLAGDQISRESGKLVQSIYESTWYNNSPSFNKDLLFIMLRTQQEMQLRGKFFSISLETFADVRFNVFICISIKFRIFQIISAAGSYITLLMSFL